MKNWQSATVRIGVTSKHGDKDWGQGIRIGVTSKHFYIAVDETGSERAGTGAWLDPCALSEPGDGIM